MVGTRQVRVAALVVAIGLTGWLVAAKPPAAPKPVQTTPSGPPTLPQIWPNAAVAAVDGQLPDGTTYLPWLYIDPHTSIGTAPTPDNSAQRLLLRVGAAPPHEVYRVVADRFPRFLGFVAAGDDVYWAEITASPNGPSQTRILRASWKSPSTPVALTTDTGAAVFFNSQYDLLVVDGQVHWVATAPTEAAITQLRSVPIGGGTVITRRIDGLYGLSTWPWLHSAGRRSAPYELLNPVTGQRIGVLKAVVEQVDCSPAWCRVLVRSPSGAVLGIDLMRPDGTDRRHIAGSTAKAATTDVALLDRFEVLTQGENATQSLVLYDIQARRLITVSDQVGVVQARGGLLWWSTGEQPTSQWHALDLRALSS